MLKPPTGRFVTPLTIVAILLIAIGVVVYLMTVDSSQQDSPSGLNTPQAIVTVSPTAKPTTSTSLPAASRPGSYVSYATDSIVKTAGTKILFFYAPWCPQCRSLEASITSGTIPENVAIMKVDYDTNQALRQKYGVTIQTTLVKIDDNGDLVKKFVAYDEPTLTSVVENLLP